MTDQIIGKNAFKKQHFLKSQNFKKAHSQHKHFGKNGRRNLNKTGAPNPYDRTGKKFYSTSSYQLFPFCSSGKKYHGNACTKWHEKHDSAHLLITYCITLKNMRL